MKYNHFLRDRCILQLSLFLVGGRGELVCKAVWTVESNSTSNPLAKQDILS